MIRTFFAVLVLCLIVPNDAAAQVSENSELEARALRDLGEYVRDARLVYSLPGPPSPQGVDLVGPPALQTFGAPLCAISVLTLYYEEAEVIGSGLQGPMRGMSARMMHRLVAENDGAPLPNYATMMRACESAARQGPSHWFAADYDIGDSRALYPAVWSGSGLLHALRRGETRYDDVDLIEFRARGEERVIRALERASAQDDLAYVRIRQCPDADGECRRAELSLRNGPTLRVTLRWTDQQRWSATVADALQPAGGVL